MEKQRLFIDMDGTLTVFTPVDEMERLFEKGFFEQAKPMENVIAAVKQIIQEQPNVEVFILSAYLTDSSYALEEKNLWLDKYLPEINQEHRLFCPCGDDKKEFIPGEIRTSDFLLDDYTQNLQQWQPPARGIKLLNNLNHTKGTWQYDRIRFDRKPKELAGKIVSVMQGRELVQDGKPERRTLKELEGEIAAARKGGASASLIPKRELEQKGR